MSLEKQFQKDLKKALKQDRKAEISILRILKSKILNEQKEKRARLAKQKDLSSEKLDRQSKLTDEEITSLLASEVKKTKEAISLFEKGDRQDLADKEKKELEIIKRYLPEQMSIEEIKKLAKEIIKQLGASEMEDMGKVMGKIMPQVKGRAPGDKVKQVIQKLLTESE